MWLHLIIGISALIVNVIIQMLTVLLVVRNVAWVTARFEARESYLIGYSVLGAVAVFLFTGHLAQIGIWAAIFTACGEFQEYSRAFYFSAVNFTTLGYGDIVMSARWRLLGALEAGTGVLMFGISTSVFFALITTIYQHHLERARKDRGGLSRKETKE
jgi:hypothetical protein